MSPRPCDPVLDAALACAARGWPVFPCQPGRKAPATAHGFRQASTNPAQIRRWFAGRPGRNLAIATGWPGPDVLDIDDHGPAGNGFAALDALLRAGLLDGAAAWVATPGGGLHAYFGGSAQRSGHLPRCHLDFRAAGGYILAPPSQVAGRPYQLLRAPGGTATLDWARVTSLLRPQAIHDQPARAGPAPRPRADGTDVARLAAWVARLEPGNRNAGLFWAANRALDAGHAAALDPLAAAARHVGLPEREITATLASARKTPRQPDPSVGRRPPGRGHQLPDPEPQAEVAT